MVDVRRISKCSALNKTSTTPTPHQSSGEMQKRELKERRHQRMWRDAAVFSMRRGHHNRGFVVAMVT